MAPKGKKGKKAADDWDEGLGETIAPIAQAEQEAKAAEAGQDDEEAGGGGLMAALKKNKEKRKKKGKAVDNEFLDGEDPTQQDGVSTPLPEAEPAVDLSAKAPEEATMDDEDVFAQPVKGKKGKQQPAKKVAEPEPDDDEDEDVGGGVKTKAQKEKEKKEREKQRKKEQAAAKKKTAPPP